jgi:hypothetical protein
METVETLAAFERAVANLSSLFDIRRRWWPSIRIRVSVVTLGAAWAREAACRWCRCSTITRITAR